MGGCSAILGIGRLWRKEELIKFWKFVVRARVSASAASMW